MDEMKRVKRTRKKKKKKKRAKVSPSGAVIRMNVGVQANGNSMDERG